MLTYFVSYSLTLCSPWGRLRHLYLYVFCQHLRIKSKPLSKGRAWNGARIIGIGRGSPGRERGFAAVRCFEERGEFFKSGQIEPALARNMRHALAQLY